MHYDYDPPEFYTEKTVQTRKPHRCCECLREIAAGETCEYVSGKWDGDLMTFYTCAMCTELLGLFGLDGRLFGQLVEEIRGLDPYDVSPQERDFIKRRRENHERLEASKLSDMSGMRADDPQAKEPSDA